MNRNQLLEKESIARNKMASYYNVAGPQTIKRVKRLFLKPNVYVQNLLVRWFALGPRTLTGHTFWGRKFSGPFRDIDNRMLCHFGTLGEPEWALIKFLIKNLKENDVFYDIGANYGFYTMLAEELIKNGEIHAFEPLPGVFKYLYGNIDGKGKSSKIFINQLALVDKIGRYPIYDASISMHSGASSMLIESLVERGKNFEVMDVECDTIDNYILKNKPPTILKIDVEGGEALVIKGAVNFLRSSNPLIIMEVWDGALGEKFSMHSIKLLEELGYLAHRLTDEGEFSLQIERDYFIKPDNLVFKKSL